MRPNTLSYMYKEPCHLWNFSPTSHPSDAQGIINCIIILTFQPCTVYCINLERIIILLLQEEDTALIVSAGGGHYETVKVLLDNGADPNPDLVSICIVYLIY